MASTGETDFLGICGSPKEKLSPCSEVDYGLEAIRHVRGDRHPGQAGGALDFRFSETDSMQDKMSR